MYTRTISGIFAYQQANKFRARTNRKQMTKAEGIIWHMVLKQRKTKYRFVRQKPIGNYIVDFYCSQLLLVVEVDGETHLYTEAKDIERTQYLNRLGLTIIRYTNEQICFELTHVWSDLVSRLDERAKQLKTVNV